MSDDLKRYKLVRGEPGYRDQMCVRPDGAWTLYEPAAARIEELTRERDAERKAANSAARNVAGVVDALPPGLLVRFSSLPDCVSHLVAAKKAAEARADRLAARVEELERDGLREKLDVAEEVAHAEGERADRLAALLKEAGEALREIAGECGCSTARAVLARLDQG